ncbi:uncharacterized protein [Spinacia oleracea]|uniref:Reverse transcriptase zinc-binding domain-containing protein n=1 Tax=Spinacia oleracea TaxID=3562 RepID=A0A9R0HY30_SPIOL|nr:uncharacterized protein LOC110777678 [Spinacia oleracea]
MLIPYYKANNDVRGKTACSGRFFWKMKIFPTWKVFFGKLLNKALPSCTNLITRGVVVHAVCKSFGVGEESLEHLFRDCELVKRIWAMSQLGLRVEDRGVPINLWVRNYMRYFWKCEHECDEKLIGFLSTLWSVWKHRNDVIFKNVPPNPGLIVQNISDNYSRSWNFIEGKKRGNKHNGVAEQVGEEAVFWVHGCTARDSPVVMEIDVLGKG